MRRAPNLSTLRGLLFLFDVENSVCLERDKIIASKDVGNEVELVELFDALMKPEFCSYTESDRRWYIEVLGFYLAGEEGFDGVFDKMSTYFDDDIQDRRAFMRVLFECLLRYQAEMEAASL
jgi:hypothetical protein